MCSVDLEKACFLWGLDSTGALSNLFRIFMGWISRSSQVGKGVRLRVLLAPSSTVCLIRPPLHPQLISVHLNCPCQTSHKIKVTNLNFYKPVKFVDLIKRRPPNWGRKRTPVLKRETPMVHDSLWSLLKEWCKKEKLFKMLHHWRIFTQIKVHLKSYDNGRDDATII